MPRVRCPLQRLLKALSTNFSRAVSFLKYSRKSSLQQLTVRGFVSLGLRPCLGKVQVQTWLKGQGGALGVKSVG